MYTVITEKEREENKISELVKLIEATDNEKDKETLKNLYEKIINAWDALQKGE